MNNQKTKIDSFYYDIDNGGIEIDVYEENETIILELKSSYFGYPCVDTRLNIHKDIIDVAEFFKQFGKTLCSVGDKLSGKNILKF